jgi:hypothetical protein
VVFVVIAIASIVVGDPAVPHESSVAGFVVSSSRSAPVEHAETAAHAKRERTRATRAREERRIVSIMKNLLIAPVTVQFGIVLRPTCQEVLRVDDAVFGGKSRGPRRSA